MYALCIQKVRPTPRPSRQQQAQILYELDFRLSIIKQDSRKLREDIRQSERLR
jgi:hypothetical protein